MSFRTAWRAAAGAAAVALGLAAPASACRLALALALDVSSSVDPAEYALQSEGLAAALEDADVQEAILAPGGPVAMAAFEWSGRNQHVIVADWTLLRSPADIAALAARVRGTPRSYTQYPTALGAALGFGAVMLGRAPPCGRRVIDVSGDGANNDGYEPHSAYKAFEFDGVTVNALVIGGPKRPALIRYFQTMVIRGPGAFTEIAADYRDFGRAMRRKLLRELRPPLVIGDAR